MPSLRSERFEHGGNVYAHPGCLDFSASLNPLGLPQAVREVLSANVDAFAQYPDPACTELTRALAEFERVPESWVVPCAGATDAFARLCAVTRPRAALVCAPCYAGYEQALAQTDAEVVAHRLDAQDGFEVGTDLVRSIHKGIDLVFIANPNNPTGRCVRPEVLVACLERAQACGTTVVLDECFIDLTQRPGSNELLGSYPHLVLVKAFTKSFALAGLRLGYALCSDKAMVEHLHEAGQPWAVSVPAQLAGVACLADKTYLVRARDLVARERDRLVRALRSCGMRVVDAEANYLMFRGPEGLADKLLDAGVLVRSCANFPGLDDTWYRIAVRTPAENDALLWALENTLAGRDDKEGVAL